MLFSVLEKECQFYRSEKKYFVLLELGNVQDFIGLT